jgi:hemolysin activation/secretion protein
MQFMEDHTNYLTVSGSSGNFGALSSFLKYYLTIDPGLPLTLVAQLGGSKTYGQQIPFYRYSFLGKYNHLRGYRRNRFMGEASVYLNTELRLYLGKSRNGLIHFEYGLTGFYDRGRVWYEGISEGGWHSGYGPVCTYHHSSVTICSRSSLNHRLRNLC